MEDSVLVSYAIYGFLYHSPEHRPLGEQVLTQLHQMYLPLQVRYVRDKTLGIILNEEEKIRIPEQGLSRADQATKARYHLISRANKGHHLREAEYIYQALLHAPPFVPSEDEKRAARAEEIYLAFSRMPQPFP